MIWAITTRMDPVRDTTLVEHTPDRLPRLRQPRQRPGRQAGSGRHQQMAGRDINANGAARSRWTRPWTRVSRTSSRLCSAPCKDGFRQAQSPCARPPAGVIWRCAECSASKTAQSLRVRGAAPILRRAPMVAKATRPSAGNGSGVSLCGAGFLAMTFPGWPVTALRAAARPPTERGPFPAAPPARRAALRRGAVQLARPPTPALQRSTAWRRHRWVPGRWP